MAHGFCHVVNLGDYRWGSLIEESIVLANNRQVISRVTPAGGSGFT